MTKNGYVTEPRCSVPNPRARLLALLTVKFRIAMDPLPNERIPDRTLSYMLEAVTSIQRRLNENDNQCPI